jgi:ABC-type branched-subunit amino acid transport system ATPase component
VQLLSSAHKGERLVHFVLACRGYVLETWRIVAKGSATAQLEDPRLQASYLGTG